MIVTDEATLEITRVFRATPEAVFDAWFVHEQWAAWIGPEGIPCDVLLMESQPGGSYRLRMTMSDGRVIPVSGVFKTVDRPKLLAFTWCWEGQDKETLITLTFTPVGEGTEFSLRQEGLETIENRDAHDRGWRSTLNKLDRFVTGQPV